ncbi:hypothetical protein H4S08_004538 [Coemansia sp. RSA 1365]|nr:hypothetical protein H4S08_004538 [Coemansia sp. RSA 1365]
MAEVNNRTPTRVSPFVQPTNERSAPREIDNRGEGGISAELTMRMLAALEGINANLDSRLPPPSSFSGSTETPTYEPTGTVPHRAPEGSANMQLPYSVSSMPQSSTTVQPPPAAARAPVGSTSAPQMNPLALSTRRAHAENKTHPPGCSSMHLGQRSHVATPTFVGFSSQLVSPTPLNDSGTVPLLRPHQGISTSWDSEATSPLLRRGPQKLPEYLPKLALNGDSYNFAMEMARALQARRYNLDEWGTEAVLLFVDQGYADAMTHALQHDPCPTCKEIVRMLLRYAPARLTSVEARQCLRMMRMDIYELLLCYPQKLEKLRMLSGMRRGAKEVRSHFLSGLDREVRIMFTGCFLTWLEDGKLDEGYAYVSELQETFNTVTRNISWYAKFHQAMDIAISAEYGTSTLNRPSQTSASAAVPWATGGDSYPRAGTTAASNARTDSLRSLGGGRDQLNVRRTEVDDNPAPAENEDADVDSSADSDWSSEAFWPEDGPTAQQVDIFGKFSRDDKSDLEVPMASVEPERELAPPTALDDTQPQATQGTVRGGPAAERALLEPWRIPVRTSAGSLTVATWAKLDTGALHTLISESIVQQLQPTITPKGGSIHLPMTSASVKRVGCFELTLCTSRHTISVRADVLPGECGLPILIGRDILARYCIDDLLSVLMDRDRKQLVTSMEADVAELAAAENSSHRTDMLAALVAEIQANTSLDRLLACRLPEAVVTIPTMGSRKVYWSQPRFGEQDSAKVDALVADLNARGFIRPAPANCPYNSLIFLVPKKDAQGKLSASRPVVDYR